MLNNSVLFVVSTNFQLMFAYIINHHIKDDYRTFLICSSKNEEVNELAKELDEFDSVLILNRCQKSLKALFKDNKTILKDASDFVETIRPSMLMVFKDNDLLNCKVIDTAFKMGTKITLLQEGLGLYTSPSFSLKSKLKTMILELMGYPKIFNGSQGLHPYVTSIAATNIKELPSVKRVNKREVEIPIMAPPKYILENFIKANKYELIKNIKDDQSRNLLFLGQPLSELGFITSSEEKTFLENIYNIMKNLGYRVIIKPHPSENLDKYKLGGEKLDIIRSNIPAELLPIYMNVAAVITPFSSAAENISLWYGLPVLYLRYLIINNESKMTYKRIGQYIYTYQEFESALNEYSNVERKKCYSNEVIRSEYKKFIKDLIQS